MNPPSDGPASSRPPCSTARSAMLASQIVRKQPGVHAVTAAVGHRHVDPSAAQLISTVTGAPRPGVLGHVCQGLLHRAVYGQPGLGTQGRWAPSTRNVMGIPDAEAVSEIRPGSLAGPGISSPLQHLQCATGIEHAGLGQPVRTA